MATTSSRWLSFPVKTVGGDEWFDLTAHGVNHAICGEIVSKKNENFSFAGGHRVRLFHFKKNVHWRALQGVVADITDVQPAAPVPVPPRRHQGRR